MTRRPLGIVPTYYKACNPHSGGAIHPACDLDTSPVLHRLHHQQHQQFSELLHLLMLPASYFSPHEWTKQQHFNVSSVVLQGRTMALSILLKPPLQTNDAPGRRKKRRSEKKKFFFGRQNESNRHFRRQLARLFGFRR